MDKERLEEILQFDIIQAIKDGFEDSKSIKQDNILDDVKWLIETIREQQKEIHELETLLSFKVGEKL